MRVLRVMWEEVSGMRGRLLLAGLLLAPFPRYTGTRMRTIVFRAIGIRIGRGSVFFADPTLTGSGDIYARLSIGEDCIFNLGTFLNLGATITIGDRVSVGHDVMFLTESHTIGPAEHRLGPLNAKPIAVGDGVWIGARSLVLPGVTIAAGSIVAAGSVITADVPQNVLVGGVPARVIRPLA